MAKKTAPKLTRPAVAAIVIIVVFVVFSIYLILRESSDDLGEDHRGENPIVFQTDKTSRREGKFIPNDLDESLLPGIPPAAEIASVVDNEQEEVRNVWIKYKLNRPESEIKDDIIEGLVSRNWEVRQLYFGDIMANKEKASMRINIENISEASNYIIVSLKIAKD